MLKFPGRERFVIMSCCIPGSSGNTTGTRPYCF